MGITLTQSDWIALSAMIVAVLALFVTIWESYQSRKHNRLSVKPLLGIGVDIHEKLEFTLSNQGIGPAVIKEFSVYFDGKLLSKNPRSDIYRELLEGSVGKYKFHIPFEGACIKEGAEKSLLGVFYDNPKTNKKSIESLSNKFAFKVVYTSIYGEKYAIAEIGTTA